MSLFRYIRYINPNQLLGNRELTSRLVLNNVSRLEQDNQLLNLNQFNRWNQRRFTRFPTVKRRVTHKFHWWQKKTVDARKYNNVLTAKNRDFIQKSIKDEYSSPLNIVQFESRQWTPESKRTGLIARKIGNVDFCYLQFHNNNNDNSDFLIILLTNS
jgi:hypothetical protein